MTTEYKKLEDYGLIGNLETCALVGCDGSIDWCCFPHLESASVFAAILDTDKGGRFQIQPLEPFESQQSYRDTTNLLETTFRTSAGTIRLTDFMPASNDSAYERRRIIFRRLQSLGGSVRIRVDFDPRFDYGRGLPSWEEAAGGVVARWHDQTLFLQGSVPWQFDRGYAHAAFTLADGQVSWFVLRYGGSEGVTEQACEETLQQTERFWLGWAHRCDRSPCVLDGPWHALTTRAGLVLKLLTHPESGAIAAAPTTSLPEAIGGVRNWDYRYAWIRDASFTVQALHNLGHAREARAYFRWLRGLWRSCSGRKTPAELQIMYGLHGETKLDEYELVHLSGYRNSAPVRIGNGAARQKQLDIYGELVNVLFETTRYGEEISVEDWEFIRRIADHVCQIWDTPDAGIWEVRGRPQHFTYSKLMCWVALDRCIRIAEGRGFQAPLGRWRRQRAAIRTAILERGFHRGLNSFVQALDSDALDATSLLIPAMGFLPADDPRVQGTIQATLDRLTVNGLVYRYNGDDGLPGGEGTFLLCTFWLVDALALCGRREEAENIYLGAVKYASPLGLFAEEVDPATGGQLGNFPQAFSHLGLINSALYLNRQRGIEPVGQGLVGLGSSPE